MSGHSEGTVARWMSKKPQQLDVAAIEEKCEALANALIEYESDCDALGVVANRLQAVSKALHDIDEAMNPERRHADSPHRNAALDAARLSHGDGKLGVIRSTVDNLAKDLGIDGVLHSKWELVVAALRERWLDEEPPKLDRVFIERLQVGATVMPTAPVDPPKRRGVFSEEDRLKNEAAMRDFSARKPLGSREEASAFITKKVGYYVSPASVSGIGKAWDEHKQTRAKRTNATPGSSSSPPRSMKKEGLAKALEEKAVKERIERLKREQEADDKSNRAKRC